VLAAVFGASGPAKLGDRAGSRQAMIDFGAPPRAAAPLAVGLWGRDRQQQQLLLIREASAPGDPARRWK
jgi:hypothetical protein